MKGFVPCRQPPSCGWLLAGLLACLLAALAWLFVVLACSLAFLLACLLCFDCWPCLLWCACRACLLCFAHLWTYLVYFGCLRAPFLDASARPKYVISNKICHVYPMAIKGGGRRGIILDCYLIAVGLPLISLPDASQVPHRFLEMPPRCLSNE